MVSAPFAAILRSGRGDFNLRFAEARKRFPSLSAEIFSQVLVDLVDPLVGAVHPDDQPETASAAYDVALELVGQGLVGPQARSRVLADGWRDLFRVAAPHVGRSPRRVLPALCNALHNLEHTPGARPQDWLRDMIRLAPLCADPATLLQVGQAAAWRAGLACYREGALAVLGSLPAPLSLTLVEGQGPWEAVRDRLAADRWFNPSRPQVAGLRTAARVGAFRGFGGLFKAPPRVRMLAGGLCVLSGEERWHLRADCFGATFHRLDPGEPPEEAPPPVGLVVDGTGVTWRKSRVPVTPQGALTSAAATADTLALTFDLSHQVILVALA